jgi:hypothetical protein
MAHTYEELKDLTVVQLREIAQGIEHEALKGFSTMHKDHLLPALCKALGIEAHAHLVAHGIEKTKIKQQIRKLKEDREAAHKAKDKVKAAEIHQQLRHLRHKLHRAALKP